MVKKMASLCVGLLAHNAQSVINAAVYRAKGRRKVAGKSAYCLFALIESKGFYLLFTLYSTMILMNIKRDSSQFHFGIFSLIQSIQ
jgi:hypothetical protein